MSQLTRTIPAGNLNIYLDLYGTGINSDAEFGIKRDEVTAKLTAVRNRTDFELIAIDYRIEKAVESSQLLIATLASATAQIQALDTAITALPVGSIREKLEWDREKADFQKRSIEYRISNGGGNNDVISLVAMKAIKTIQAELSMALVNDNTYANFVDYQGVLGLAPAEINGLTKGSSYLFAVTTYNNF